MELGVLNDEKVPMLERKNGSYIDLTLVCNSILSTELCWEVLNDHPSLSDHHFIWTEIPEKDKKYI